MDKLTMLTTALSQPNRAVVFSSGPGDPKPLVECAACALKYLEVNERERGDHSRYVLRNTDVAMVTPWCPIRCACGVHLEYA